MMMGSSSDHIDDDTIRFAGIEPRATAHHLGEQWCALRWARDDDAVDRGFVVAFGEHSTVGDDPRLAWAANYGQEETPGGPVRPQGAWSRSKDGVRDLDGNVWEWTASCMDTQQAGVTADRCPAFKAMGAHTATVSVFVRNPAAGGCSSGKPPTHIGFRLVEDMGEPQS